MSVKYSRGLYKFLRNIVGVCIWPLVRTKYTNRNNIKEEGRYVFASNHVSFADPIFVGVGQKIPIRFMGKAELFKNPITNWFFTKMGAFPVDRASNDGEAIKYAMKVIDGGDALGIFIEGTRSKTGELLRPRSGAVMIAHQMNCKIIPVCVTYRTKKQHFFSRRYVSFGEPVSTKDLGVTEGTPRELRNASRELMNRIEVMWKRDKYGN
ncbi:MAG: lysophospholipid acyltransferase family protein [Eubacteriales bacterium]|nr:lysophospholipid acyltransferase family protein [Eubacteriales bacterium]